MMSLGNSRIGSCLGRFGRNQLSNMHGDVRVKNLTPQVQALFGSTKGLMYDFTQSAYLYQNSTRTTPVTASGQAIGGVVDLSPNALHGTSAGSNRPLWFGYSSYDGFDDCIQAAGLDLSTATSITVVASVRRASQAAVRTIVEFSVTTLNNGIFALFAPDSGGSPNAVFYSRGTATTTSALTMGAAPSTAVLTGQGSLLANTTQVSVNSTDGPLNSGSQAGTTYRNDTLNIGARNGGASNPLNGFIYRIFVYAGTLNASNLKLTRQWAAQPVGIIIP